MVNICVKNSWVMNYMVLRQIQWECIDKCLRELMYEETYAHAKRVGDEAESLAVRYGIDAQNAKLAGIIHDCARNFPSAVLLQKAQEFGIVINAVEQCAPVLLHGPVGAKIAEQELRITDPDVLNAVCFHTTGREGMSVLEKLIYLADYIEPARDFPGLEAVRQLAYMDLDRSLLKVFDMSLTYLLQTGKIIHTRTIQARNWLLSSG